MTEASGIVFKVPRRKTRAYTRRYLHRLADARARELKADSKAAREGYQASRAAYYRALVPFRGCDPERTLALIGEER